MNEESTPLLPRLLRLRHLQLSRLERALLGDVPVGAAVLLSLADLASAWAVVILPATVLAMVKLHDLVAGAVVRGRPVTSPAAAGPAGPGRGGPAGPAAGKAQPVRPRGRSSRSGRGGPAGPAAGTVQPLRAAGKVRPPADGKVKG